MDEGEEDVEIELKARRKWIGEARAREKHRVRETTGMMPWITVVHTHMDRAEDEETPGRVRYVNTIIHRPYLHIMKFTI